MSDLLLRVARRDRGRYRNPWLAPGTSIPLLLVLLLVVAVFFPSLFNCQIRSTESTHIDKWRRAISVLRSLEPVMPADINLDALWGTGPTQA